MMLNAIIESISLIALQYTIDPELPKYVTMQNLKYSTMEDSILTIIKLIDSLLSTLKVSMDHMHNVT